MNQDHLHADRRSAGARHLFAAADRPGVHAGGGLRRRDARHLARRPHPRAVSRSGSTPAQAVQRRSRRARRAREDARGQHHQAAEHQRLGPAAAGRDQGAAAAGLRRAGLSGGAAQRRREGDQGEVRQGARQRRQSGAARRQLGSPRRGVGEAVREEASALDGRAGARTRRRTSRT